MNILATARCQRQPFVASLYLEASLINRTQTYINWATHDRLGLVAKGSDILFNLADSRFLFYEFGYAGDDVSHQAMYIMAADRLYKHYAHLATDDLRFYSFIPAT